MLRTNFHWLTFFEILQSGSRWLCWYLFAGCNNQAAVTGRIDTEVDTLIYKIPTLATPSIWVYNDIIITGSCGHNTVTAWSGMSSEQPHTHYWRIRSRDVVLMILWSKNIFMLGWKQKSINAHLKMSHISWLTPPVHLRYQLLSGWQPVKCTRVPRMASKVYRRWWISRTHCARTRVATGNLDSDTWTLGGAAQIWSTAATTTTWSDNSSNSKRSLLALCALRHCNL